MNNNIKVTIIEYWGIDTLATLCEPTTYYEAVKTTNMGFYQLCGSIWVNINGEPQEAVIRDISLTMKEGELLGVTLAVSLLK